MPYALLADAVLILHGLFVVFVILGGLLYGLSRRWAWVHLPALAWGVLIEWKGWICPLTPLEYRLRQTAQEIDAAAGVVERYLVPLLYPVGLTRDTQWLLGIALIVINLAIYGLWIARSQRR
ncbi:MAG: DUF2784 domain-containing protein [Proteobacteria bacterium]|nr:MAG: DUF2784 domain-containing protein [Pseudomonadota bacterium]QKK10875.1 MAG: DUF2784 domain-containing protein [Pseudomonadota bacterium]